MIIGFIRWLRGTVTFIISGSFPERLITRCQKAGIPLWNIKPKQAGISADSYASDYKKLRHFAKESKVRMRLTEKRGAFILLKRYRRRKGIAIGAAAAVLLILFCSSRIWSIMISGCSDELKKAVADDLIRYGVTAGCRKDKIDVKDIQRQMMMNNEGIAWIALNIVGSTAFVEVSEVKSPPEVMDPADAVANIVAECDGQIKYIEVYDGALLVKVGQPVSKGDILVSGIMEDQYGKKQMKYARAKVIARVSEEIRADVPLKQAVWQADGKSIERMFVGYKDKQLPLFPIKAVKGAYSMVEQRKKVLFFDVIKRIYTPQTLCEYTLTEKQAKEQAMLLLDGRDISDGEKLISRSRNAQLLNGIYSVTERRELEKDIAKTVEIEWIK